MNDRFAPSFRLHPNLDWLEDGFDRRAHEFNCHLAAESTKRFTHSHRAEGPVGLAKGHESTPHKGTDGCPPGPHRAVCKSLTSEMRPVSRRMTKGFLKVRSSEAGREDRSPKGLYGPYLGRQWGQRQDQPHGADQSTLDGFGEARVKTDELTDPLEKALQEAHKSMRCKHCAKHPRILRD